MTHNFQTKLSEKSQSISSPTSVTGSDKKCILDLRIKYELGNQVTKKKICNVYKYANNKHKPL